MAVVGTHGRHLPSLKIRDLAMWVHEERIDPFAGLEGFQCRAARITRSCPDDGQPLAAFRQDMIHQAGEDLHSHILERERRPVKQFQQPVVRAELHQRHHGRMMKGAVGLFDHAAQGFVGNLAIDKLCDNLKGNLRIRLAAKIRDLVSGETGPCLGNIKPAISGQTSKQSFFKC